MKRGDLYLVSLDPSAGHEQRGSRPVLIISPTSFNLYTAVPIILPVTFGGRFAHEAGYTVDLPQGSLRTRGSIRCDQPRSLDLKPRAATFFEAFPDETLEEGLDRISAFFA